MMSNILFYQSGDDSEDSKPRVRTPRKIYFPKTVPKLLGDSVCNLLHA